MAQVIIDKLYIGNDNDIWLKAFRDSRAAEGVYLNAATVSFQIKTANGSVFKSTEPMGYVVDSDGIYVGSLESTDSANLIEGGIYYVEITAQEGDVDGFWREQAVACYRET